MTQGSLLITANTVRKGEDRLRSGKECLLIIILGVPCQCQPCGEERQSLQREAGRRRQWVWGSQPVIAFHCYSLHSPYTPVQPPKLCAPARTWPKRHEDLLHVLVRFKNPYACEIISARKENKQFFCCISCLENTLWCQILRPYCLHSVVGYTVWKRMRCEFVNRGAAGTLRGREQGSIIF